MTRTQLLTKLNWFYTLELNQVDLYTEQSKQVDDVYLSNTFSRIAMIEQQHVDNLAEKIKELGSKPIVISDVLSPIAGKMLGKASSIGGVCNILKLDITLEEKAMHDYKKLILRVGEDPELFKLLWNNLVDEDLHKAWFANKLEALSGDTSPHYH